MARNAAVVKVAKDLKKKEVLSQGEDECAYLGGEMRCNRGIIWLTNYTSTSESVTRMKTAPLQGGRVLLYWEIWSRTTYQRSELMIVDSEGHPVKGPWVIPTPVALPYSDDLGTRGGSSTVAYTGYCDYVCEGQHYRGTQECRKENCRLIRYELCAGAACSGGDM